SESEMSKVMKTDEPRSSHRISDVTGALQWNQVVAAVNRQRRHRQLLKPGDEIVPVLEPRLPVQPVLDRSSFHDVLRREVPAESANDGLEQVGSPNRRAEVDPIVFGLGLDITLRVLGRPRDRIHPCQAAFLSVPALLPKMEEISLRGGGGAQEYQMRDEI